MIPRASFLGFKDMKLSHTVWKNKINKLAKKKSQNRTQNPNQTNKKNHQKYKKYPYLH